MNKKLLKTLKISIPSLIVAGVVIGIPFSAINSSSYNLFAQLVVSDNTSVLADNSFSQSTFDGFNEFLKTNNIDLPNPSNIQQSTGIWRRPGNTTLEREATFKGMYASGTNMAIAPGFNHQTAIQNVAENPLFSDMGFLLLDSNVNLPNVSSFLFRADQSGFLSGVAACQFLKENIDVFGADGSLKIGGFVGLAFPSTMDFLGGFQAGMFAWNAAHPTDKQVEWISLGSTQSDYASGSFSVGGGVQKTQQLIDAGADVIIPIAGPQTADAVGEITKRNKTIAVVGVDSPQEYQTINKPMPNGANLKHAYQSNGENMVIQFSAVKKLANATNSVLNAIFDKEDPNNVNDTLKTGIKGFGYMNTGTISSQTVGVSDEGLPFVQAAFPSWFNGSNLLASEVLKNPEFISMTNGNNKTGKEGQSYLYYTNTGLGTLTSPTANKLECFSNLIGGVAVAEDVAPGVAHLNGSNWKISR